MKNVPPRITDEDITLLERLRDDLRKKQAEADREWAELHRPPFVDDEYVHWLASFLDMTANDLPPGAYCRHLRAAAAALRDALVP